MPSLLLGIDIGTYSSKGALIAPDGRVLKTRVVEHSMDVPRPGWAEQDADAVWWADTVSLCRALLDGQPYTGADVAAVGVSAIGPCMLPLDAADRPLRKGLLYGVDARATVEIDLLNRALGEDAVFTFSNMALSSQATGPKIVWMRRNEPERWSRVRHITTASSYLILRLTGERVMNRHEASHFMPLFDPQAGNWSDRYAEHVCDPALLPRPAWSDALAGRVSAAGASETGLRPGTPVSAGAVDALSEAVSVGVAAPGDLMLMYGSTAFFILVLDAPAPDRRMWTVGGAFPGQYNLAAGMATTGTLTRWFRDTLAADLPRDTAYATLFAEAAAAEPGAGGLLVLPYFSGERTPINDPNARGAIFGLTLAHTRRELFRATLEGVAYGIRHNLETFAAIGAQVRRVVAVGGGAQTDVWMQIVSDVAGVAQAVPAVTLGASYGDAFLAGLAAGILQRSDLAAWVGGGRVIAPNPALRPRYDALYADYLRLYAQTKDIAHRLSA